MKKIQIAVLCFLSGVFLQSHCIVAQSAVINDLGLNEGLKENLHLTETQSITVAQLNAVKELDLTGYGILDLTGLQNCVNLEYLKISSNQILNLSPILNLSKIKYLDLSSNILTSINNLNTLRDCIIFIDQNYISITPNLHFSNTINGLLNQRTDEKLGNFNFTLRPEIIDANLKKVRIYYRSGSDINNNAIMNVGDQRITSDPLDFGLYNCISDGQTRYIDHTYHNFGSHTIFLYFSTGGSQSTKISSSFNIPQPTPIVPTTVINIQTPTTVSFGSVNVGGSFDKTITIKNASTSNAVLTGTLAAIGGADMNIISGSQTLNLAPNQSQDVTVRFSPQSGGVHNNSLNINGNFNGTSKSINLTGTGVTVLPTLTYSRAPGQTYTLLDAPMGNFSEGIITVSNNSSAAFSGSFSVSGSGYSGFVAGGGSNLSIPAGGFKNITVRFTPTATGTSTGSLNITGSATNTPATFNFSALGTGFPTSGCVTSNITIKTSVVDISYTGWREFGRFTLTNTSNTLPANITNFKIGGADNPRFRVIGYQNTTFSLNAGESREFVVDINPITTQGTYSGVMIVGSGPIGAGCNLNIDLRGTPASTALNPPLLIEPVADYVIPFTGINYGMSLFYRKNNVNGLANYKVYLKDLTTNQVLFDYYNEGTLPTKSPTAQNVFQTFNYGNVVSTTGHQYAWKIRAESVNDPNVYTDSELRFFSALQPTVCTAPTDFSITDISKNSALITWNAVPNAFSYNIETSSDGGQTYNGTQFNLTTPQSTISNLTNSTLYKVRLISNCGQGKYNINQYTRSQPSINKAFTTLGDCSTLTSTISPNTAQVICQGTSVNLTSSAGSSYKWYKDNNLITGATSQVYSAGQAGTYKAKVLHANGCEVFSNEVSVTEITKPSVSISSNSNGICPNSSVVLSTTQISGMTYQWIKDGTNIPNATSSSYTAVASGVYQLSYTQNGCAFTTDLFNLSALPEPVIYVTGNTDLTMGNTMNLSASGASAYTWTGPSFTSTLAQIAIPNIQMSNAGNYNVTGTGLNGCTSSVGFAVTVSPQPPSVTSATINSGQTATLTASGCNGTVNWYNAVSGGTSLNTGTSFTTPSLTATTTYYASCTINNVVSTSRGSGVVTVNSSCTPPQPPTVSSATINSGQTATLTASGCGGTVNWYSDLSGGTSLAAAASFITPSLTATTTYYANCTVGGRTSTTRGSGTVTVVPVVPGEVTSIKSGSWHDPSTWDCNCVPNKDHDVEIKNGHTVTVSTGDANLKNLKYSGGSLTFQDTRKLCFGCTSSDLTAGLVAYYPFSGNANDASGNGNNGTPYEGATLTDDRKGTANGAYSFGGFSNRSYIQIPNSNSLQFADSFSISLWYSLNTFEGMDGYGRNVSQGYHMLFAKDSDRGGFYAGVSGNTSLDSVYYNVTNRPNFNTTNFNASASFKGANSGLNIWICMTYVVENSQVKIFRNGVLIKTEPNTNALNLSAANTKNLYLGRFSISWYPLNGKMDDVRVYNRALSDAEVTEIYNLEK